MRASHSKPCLHHEAATCRRSRPPMSLPHSSRHGVLGAGAIHASLAGLGTPRACERRPCLGFFTHSPPLTHAIRRTYVQFLVLVLSPSCDRLGRSYAAGPRTVCVTNLPNLNEGGPSEVRGITTRIACVYKAHWSDRAHIHFMWSVRTPIQNYINANSSRSGIARLGLLQYARNGSSDCGWQVSRICEAR